MWNPFTTIRAAVMAGLGTALVLTLCWGLRVDHLRAGYKDALSRVVVALHSATGQNVTAKNAPIAVQALDNLRLRYLAERKTDRAKLAQQSASITAAAQRTEELAAQRDKNLALYREMERQRNWAITDARNAETRTEWLSDNEEARQCAKVMDGLREDGL